MIQEENSESCYKAAGRIELEKECRVGFKATPRKPESGGKSHGAGGKCATLRCQKEHKAYGAKRFL